MARCYESWLIILQCKGGLPCEGCRQITKVKFWDQSCTPANFADVVKEGTCNAVCECHSMVLELVGVSNQSQSNMPSATWLLMEAGDSQCPFPRLSAYLDSLVAWNRVNRDTISESDTRQVLTTLWIFQVASRPWRRFINHASWRLTSFRIWSRISSRDQHGCSAFENTIQ